MGLDRKLRRQQQRQNGHGAPNNNPLGQLQQALGGPNNPLAQLQGALGNLQKVSELGQAAQALQDKLGEAQALVDELSTLRDELKGSLVDVEDMRVELGRQRAVFMRFLAATDSMVATPVTYLEKFLQAEERYRGEYDAMLLLVKLASWAKEAP